MSTALHTEVRFASFLSGGFTTMAVINQPEWKLAKRTFVHCAVANSNYDLVGKTRLFGGGGGVEQIKEVRQLGDLFPVWN